MHWGSYGSFVVICLTTTTQQRNRSKLYSRAERFAYCRSLSRYMRGYPKRSAPEGLASRRRADLLGYPLIYRGGIRGEANLSAREYTVAVYEGT